MNDSDHTRWASALRAAGFTRAEGGVMVHESGKLVAQLREGWIEFESDAGPHASADVAGPGLWKIRPSGDFIRRFACLPLWIATSEDDYEEDSVACAPARLIEWMVATNKGVLPAGWLPPPQALVDSWIPNGGFTIQVAGIICQGQTVLVTARWALRFTLCSLPATVADRQIALFRDVLIPDAEALWQTVRFVWEEDADQHELRVEVDLSGAPHSEALFRTAYDACGHAIRWLAPVANLLSQPMPQLQALEMLPLACTARQTTRTTKQTNRKDQV